MNMGATGNSGYPRWEMVWQESKQRECKIDDGLALPANELGLHSQEKGSNVEFYILK